jgi:hypothetical protein
MQITWFTCLLLVRNLARLRTDQHASMHSCLLIICMQQSSR